MKKHATRGVGGPTLKESEENLYAFKFHTSGCGPFRIYLQQPTKPKDLDENDHLQLSIHVINENRFFIFYYLL